MKHDEQKALSPFPCLKTAKIYSDCLIAISLTYLHKVFPVAKFPSPPMDITKFFGGGTWDRNRPVAVGSLGTVGTIQNEFPVSLQGST